MVLGPLIHLIRALPYHSGLPTTADPQWCNSHLSILDGVRKTWVTLTASCTAGKAGAHLYVVTLVYGRAHGLRKSLMTWGHAQGALGGVVMWGRSNYSSNPFSASSLYFFFFSNCVLELLHWTPRFSQRFFRSWVIIKIGVPLGEDYRKVLFGHVDDVTTTSIFDSFL